MKTLVYKRTLSCKLKIEEEDELNILDITFDGDASLLSRDEYKEINKFIIPLEAKFKNKIKEIKITLVE
jgi:hypothetical protein